MSRRHREPMRDLLERIVSGEIPAGEMLPREVDLAEQYDVSRGVARECIRGLEERGAISVRHGKGATVCAAEHWNVLDAEVLAALFATGKAGALVADILECQRLLEVEAAGWAALRAAPADVEALDATLRELEAASERAARSPIAAARQREARLALHRAVMRASGNRALPHMSEPLYRALATAGARAGATKGFAAELAECRDVVRAIAEHDEDGARRAMDEHLRALARRLRVSGARAR